METAVLLMVVMPAPEVLAELQPAAAAGKAAKQTAAKAAMAETVLPQLILVVVTAAMEAEAGDSDGGNGANVIAGDGGSAPGGTRR